MMITPYNVLRHELIGLEAKIVDASHPGYVVSGTISDETRSTIAIKGSKGEKKVPKDSVVLELNLPDKSVVRVDGKLLVARPQERLKKKYRIKFN